MKERKVMYRALLCYMLMCVSIGCASFPKHNLPDVKVLPPLVDTTQAIPVRFQAEAWGEVGKNRKALKQQQAKTKEVFAELLEESGYFSTVYAEDEGPLHGGGKELRINIAITKYGSMGTAISAGVISGLSLTAIPVWVSDNWKLEAEVTTPEGAPRDYVLKDGMVTVQWLPMLLALPFATPWDTADDVIKNMGRQLLREMVKDGLLPPVNNL